MYIAHWQIIINNIITQYVTSELSNNNNILSILLSTVNTRYPIELCNTCINSEFVCVCVRFVKRKMKLYQKIHEDKSKYRAVRYINYLRDKGIRSIFARLMITWFVIIIHHVILRARLHPIDPE